MTVSRRRFIAITAGVVFAAKAGRAGLQDGARWQGISLGAQADLRIVGISKADAERLLDLARAEIERLEKQFSLYRTDSALVRLNMSGSLHNPSPDMIQLLSLAGSLHAASHGLFDPTVQPLWSVYAESGGNPSQTAITGALAKTGWNQIKVSPAIVQLPHGGALTLNGIAQGFITDKVVSLLKAHGLEHALINVGEISAVGAPATLDAWPIQLHGPDNSNKTIRLNDRAVATSDPLGTTLDSSGSVSHIFDPRNGHPALIRWHRVSTFHRSAAVADGLSTAGVLLGSDELAAMVRRFNGATVDAISRDGSTFRA